MTAPSRVSTAVTSLRVKGLGVLMATAVAGGLAGIAIDRSLRQPAPVSTRPPTAMPPFSGFPSAEMRSQISDRIAMELQLSSTQKQQLEVIVERQIGEMRRVAEKNRPVIDSLLTATQQQLNTILTPEQRVRLDSLRPRMMPPLP